mmetsp:Transcript_4487/g.6811  ORF Transcript_4487/g.6811 Transcript_4487/m.6811 type:complete len:350 (-) Transcript_4487:97-1146(-)
MTGKGVTHQMAGMENFLPLAQPLPLQAQVQALSSVRIHQPRKDGLGQVVGAGGKSVWFDKQLDFWKEIENKRVAPLPPLRKRRRRTSAAFQDAKDFWETREKVMKTRIEEDPPQPVNTLEVKFHNTRQIWDSNRVERERRVQKNERDRERRKKLTESFQDLAVELKLHRGGGKDLNKEFILKESRTVIKKLRHENSELRAEKEEMNSRIKALEACLQSMCMNVNKQLPVIINSSHPTVNYPPHNPNPTPSLAFPFQPSTIPNSESRISEKLLQNMSASMGIEMLPEPFGDSPRLSPMTEEQPKNAGLDTIIENSKHALVDIEASDLQALNLFNPTESDESLFGHGFTRF